MPKKSSKRAAAEAVLSDPHASKLAKADAALVIARLNKLSAYQSAYEKARRGRDPEYLAKRRRSKSEWKKRNSAATYSAVRRHHEKRYKEDPKFRLDMLMRATIHRGLRGRQKTSAYIRHLDWDFMSLRRHIEAQFCGGMTWDNWGEIWELDHVQPRANFDYDSSEHPEFVACWGKANLKPTLKHENREQGYALSNPAGQ